VCVSYRYSSLIDMHLIGVHLVDIGGFCDFDFPKF
jgi:hypothetical protein